ncbi:MAG: butyrate kinase [Mycoplasmataceae bacterium]|jgi:butyrate kinase|nr:butyrate kinase [Mycoplasmataceae bacterium]
MRLILVINPGSTSTKLAIYRNDQLKESTTLRHSPKEINAFHSVAEQQNYRQAMIDEFLKKTHYKIQDFQYVVARGGLIKPVQSGTFIVNQAMVNDLKHAKYGEHASNLGAIIAFQYFQKYKIPAYIVDPVVVDEMNDIARVSGTNLFERRCAFHALNHKAVAKRYAANIKRKYESLNLIVAHLGGGISIAWHHLGKAIDVNNALGGDGPFSPERAGGVPVFPLVDLCFSNKLSKSEIKKCLVGHGGMVAYLGTSDIRSIEEKANNGNKQCDFYIRAMAYQVAKEIGGLYFAANGKIDQLIITGGIAYSKLFMKYLLKHLDKNIKYTIYPGEDEMQALFEGALRVLTNKEKSLIYK